MARNRKITEEVNISGEEFSKTEENVKHIPDFEQEINNSLDEKTTELIKTLLGGAIALNASDIHFEPQEERSKLRVRMDGVLHDVLFISKEKHGSVVSRIKLLSGIKLNITDRPQDGRFSIIVGKTSIEVRVSTIPAEHGESVVMRILDPKSLKEIEKLGLREDLLGMFKQQIKEPNGMVIVTGPTGSGKTTTLYAFLKRINTPEKKIITIENPIEYHLKGISQTQVDRSKGYDFASGLQSIMRQDPDVILVGEIRNLETAKIALQASLTGHLVFTTVHTNDAAGTVTRLQSLGAKLVNVAPAIRLAIGQRLVRRLCPKCGELISPSSEDLKKIKEELKGIPDKVSVPEINDDLKIPKANGCEFCDNTGYRGRTGIFEAFKVDEDIEQLILKNPSISDLRRMLLNKGMVTMRQDGFIKVLEQKTTIEEVDRVTVE